MSTPPLEHQEAWLNAQFAAMSASLDLDIPITWDPINHAVRLGMKDVPWALVEIVDARIAGILEEGNRRFGYPS